MEVGIVGPDGHGMLPIAVMAASASQLVWPHLAEGANTHWLLETLGKSPIGLSIIATGVMLYESNRRASFTASIAKSLMGFLGIALFGLAVAIPFILYHTRQLGPPPPHTPPPHSPSRL